ncbi:MAG: hypothetical protein Q9159_004430 [Coniocarpon cinnabarinum]
MAQTIIAQTALEELGNGRYQSIHPAEKMGKYARIAYGGCTIGVALRAAFRGVPQHLYMYSAQGNFLGPAQAGRKYVIHVKNIRQTRSFSTQFVEVFQKQDKEELRHCMILVADFQAQEKQSVLEYSSSPVLSYSSLQDSKTTEKLREQLLKSGHLNSGEAERHKQAFTLVSRFWDVRQCPEGIGSQNAYGVAKRAPTTQDDRSLVDKTTAEWFRSPCMLTSQEEHISALGLILDAGMAFMPLMHNKIVGVCSTLDFSLRLLTNGVNLNKWLLRELRAIAGGSGRTYSEQRVWDEDGHMVCALTEQNILRSKL